MLFDKFNFKLLDSPDFKEDSVREDLVAPMLEALGYSRSGDNQIVSSKKLLHPFIKIGSKKRPITQFPDYLLQVNSLNAWVLDAKGPNEEIRSGDNVEQVYSYAIHPEVRVKFFALCNGREFVLFRTEETNPILDFNLDEIDKHWNKINSFLRPESFARSVTTFSETSTTQEEPSTNESFDYLSRPLLREIRVKKQAAKRHFGVHGYFTKQVWNVVGEYIRNFTKPGDLVLDPFGGSGVTAVEALMLGRKAIHIDLNPLSAFIVKALTVPVNASRFAVEFARIKKTFLSGKPETEEEIRKALRKYPYPKGIKLSKDADVGMIEDLFSNKQLAQLAFLKDMINQIKDQAIKDSLRLAFSSTITKTNLTYHSSSTRGENAGDAAAFRYYRYRLAKIPVDLDLMHSFEHKVSKLLAAKREMAPIINEGSINDLLVHQGDATNLGFIDDETVDYIYTDPPYGSKIAYLDLSAMWNAWLDLDVSEDDFRKEIIEGGSRGKTKDEYSTLLAASIKEMYRKLKFNRWMSFVFSHKDPHYWHLIVDTAERAGFEYAGAVLQDNGQSSFKKRQHSFTVLSHQLILNFKKVQTPKSILKANLGSDIGALVLETIEGIIAKFEGATLEEINSALVLQGLELGFLDVLSKQYSDLTPLLKENFDYNTELKKYYLKDNAKFKTHIPLELRIKYYLLSFLKRRERENNPPDFDEIVLNIIPLLKNGGTPENQSILSVLKQIGEKTTKGHWKLKPDDGQQSLAL